MKEYPLVPERGWEADVAALEALVDDNTRAIVVNNPSNPCGSVFSDACLRGIVEVRNTHAHAHARREPQLRLRLALRGRV